MGVGMRFLTPESRGAALRENRGLGIEPSRWDEEEIARPDRVASPRASQRDASTLSLCIPQRFFIRLDIVSTPSSAIVTAHRSLTTAHFTLTTSFPQRLKRPDGKQPSGTARRRPTAEAPPTHIAEVSRSLERSAFHECIEPQKGEPTIKAKMVAVTRMRIPR